jgi:predicted nucleotidyltransferase
MMSSVVQYLTERNLITPPKYVSGSVQFEVLVGSEAYGVASGQSDRDVYGFCIPPRSLVFPHTAGEIHGFGRQVKRFQQYQQHHIYDQSGLSGRGCQWDLSIYNIVRYFQLCMENNPNMIDSLFVPDRCILYITRIGTMVRDQRQLFLHKGSWHKFKGYAYSQVKKMMNKKPDPNSKRYEMVKKHGYDCKFAYHVIRLLNEVEQILTESDLSLDRNREQLKAIRNGEWTSDQVKRYFNQKESDLESLYTSSTLRYEPDEDAIKGLLFACLEAYYGSLEGTIALPNAEKEVLREIDAALNKIRHRL